jgi:transposase
MYPTETINQFIELRAQNISQRRAAEKLGIHRDTALVWDAKYEDKIAELRAYEMEAIQEQFIPSAAEEMAFLGDELKRLNAELRTRDFDYEATTFLANRQSSILARLDKLKVTPVRRRRDDSEEPHDAGAEEKSCQNPAISLPKIGTP